MHPTIEHSAPAKVNLALAVGPGRADGLHPIRSWMVTVDLCDHLAVTRLDPDRLSIYAVLWHDDALSCSEIDWSIRDDLAVQAHLALEARVGRPLPVRMKLEKRIPVGSGLGGGSSDAAAMLRAVNMLYALGLTTNELAEIGASLGADVPFLVHGGSALAEGIGQRLTLHDDVPDVNLVLVMPPVMCNTAAVYARFDELGDRVDRFDAIDGLLPPSRAESDMFFNDLAPAARSVQPALAEVMDTLAELARGPVHLTGSGSCCFLVCDDAMHAEALAGEVAEQMQIPSVAVRPTGIEGCMPGPVPESLS